MATFTYANKYTMKEIEAKDLREAKRKVADLHLFGRRKEIGWTGRWVQRTDGGWFFDIHNSKGTRQAPNGYGASLWRGGRNLRTRKAGK